MKTNWMLFLVGFSMFLSACNKKESEIKMTFTFNNTTDSLIKFIIMGNISEGNSLFEDTSIVHAIEPNESYSLQLEGMSDKTIDELYNGVLKTNYQLGDSVKIIYGPTKYLMYYKDKTLGNDSLYIESNYEYNKTSNYSAVFYYDFTESDFDRIIY